MKIVTLTMNHKEGDVQYYAGQTVTLPDESADYLIGAMLTKRAEQRIVESAPVVSTNTNTDDVLGKRATPI